MSGWLIVAVAVGALVVGRAALAFLRARRHPVVARALIVTAREHTETDEHGAVRSVQAADLVLPADRVDELWTPTQLERLARTYWRFLSRCTLGLVRVVYTPRERFVVFVTRPFVLLSFAAPEYDMDARHGRVGWRIARGLLVARAGRGGDGYLQLDVTRSDPSDAGEVTVHVTVEVANFYPAIASRLSRFVYENTQSRIHVIVTHGFLRSLARLDLAESRVGRFAGPSRTALRR
ncbi:MAG: hypothetical protein QOE65_2541 [Solirubrobacteraceae bacterium]|jgi:hypothetical protein|nr:hypothetical protein [Solirubrobacteraceae bacterium]